MIKRTTIFALLPTVALLYGATSNLVADTSDNSSKRVLTIQTLDVKALGNQVMATCQTPNTSQPVVNITCLSAINSTPAPAGNAMFSEISYIFPGIYHSNGLSAVFNVSTAPAANGYNAGNLNQLCAGATPGNKAQINYNHHSIGSTNMSLPALPLEKTLVQSKASQLNHYMADRGIA